MTTLGVQEAEKCHLLTGGRLTLILGIYIGHRLCLDIKALTNDFFLIITITIFSFQKCCPILGYKTKALSKNIEVEY